MTTLSPAQTSVPDWLMTYCRQLADVHYSRKLSRMYIHMLEGFLAYKPWKASPPLTWRVAKIHGMSGMNTRKGTDSGWVPMNMMLPQELADRIKEAIESINLDSAHEGRKLSLRTFLYTAISWWCTSVYPYQGPGMISE
jgi:hypothetical protein